MSKIGQIGQEELISIRAGIGIALNFGSPELARQALEVAKQLDLVIPDEEYTDESKYDGKIAESQLFAALTDRISTGISMHDTSSEILSRSMREME